jgi:hypothetical protein
MSGEEKRSLTEEAGAGTVGTAVPDDTGGAVAECRVGSPEGGDPRAGRGAREASRGGCGSVRPMDGAMAAAEDAWRGGRNGVTGGTVAEGCEGGDTVLDVGAKWLSTWLDTAGVLPADWPVGGLAETVAAAAAGGGTAWPAAGTWEAAAGTLEAEGVAAAGCVSDLTQMVVLWIVCVG